MKKELIEKYKDRFVVIGVPHTFKENALFYYNGILTYLSDESLTITRGSNELTLSIDMIKSIKSSGNTGENEQ